MGRDRSTATPPSCPTRLAALHSFISFTSSISFTSNSLRTLLHNGRSSTPLQSIRYALFSSRRGGVLPPSSGLQLPMPYSLSTISFLFKYVRTLLHFFALFCAYQKLNSFLFKRFRTLCRKHPGWMWAHKSPLSPSGFPPLHPIKSPRCPHPACKWAGQSRNHYE